MLPPYCTLSAFHLTAAIIVLIRPTCASRRTMSATIAATSPIYCRTSADCVEDIEKKEEADWDATKNSPTCHWLYEGCPTGQCMCDPIRQKRHPTSGKCISVRLGGDTCRGGNIDACPEGMVCHTGLCRCPHSGAEMTTDRQHCLRRDVINRRHKLLGETCSPILDACYHKAVYGYTQNDVECNPSSGLCECSAGGRKEGITCRNLKLNEHGCTRYHHCEGGAICSEDRRCVCPKGYTSSASDEKCVKVGAVRDLPLGAECDEINDRHYCARGLVCHRCSDADGAVYHCVRFRLTLTSDLGFLMSGSVGLRPLGALLSSSWLLAIVVLSTVVTSCVDRTHSFR